MLQKTVYYESVPHYAMYYVFAVGYSPTSSPMDIVFIRSSLHTFFFFFFHHKLWDLPPSDRWIRDTTPLTRLRVYILPEACTSMSEKRTLNPIHPLTPPQTDSVFKQTAITYIYPHGLARGK